MGMLLTQARQNTKLPDNSFTHVAVSMGFHIIPDPDAVLKGTGSSYARHDSSKQC